MGQLVPVQTRIHSGITSHVQSFPFCLNKKASREVGVIPSSLLVDYLTNYYDLGDWEGYQRCCGGNDGVLSSTSNVKTQGSGIKGTHYTAPKEWIALYLGSRILTDYLWYINIPLIMSSGSLGAPANASGHRYEQACNQYTGISYIYRNYEIYGNHYVGSRSA